MTSKELIAKLLDCGFKDCGDDRYGKRVGGIVVVATISEYDKPTEPGWVMPHLRVLMGDSLIDANGYWNASRLNQALASRGYFK